MNTVNRRVCTAPLFKLVNPTVVEYTPIGRLYAAGLSATTTASAGPPGTSVPLVNEKLSQLEGLPADQAIRLVPTLVSVHSCELCLNGPPTGPLAVNPMRG